MSDEKRQKIFNVYSDNLLMLKTNGLLEGVKFENTIPYVCPICLKEFSEKDLDTSLENHLTLEDVPPRSLGGKSNILTCKKCNNTCGHEIDAHLVNRVKELDQSKFFWGSEAKVKVKKNGFKVNGVMKIDSNGTMTMLHSELNNDPTILREFLKLVRKDEIINVTFMAKKVNDERLRIALLKTGYLLFFQRYGYSLIFTNSFDRIRKQLQNPSENIFPLDFWFLGPFPVELVQAAPFVIETGLGCAFPFFQITTGRASYIFATILPVNNKSAEEIIEGFKKKFDELSEFNISMKQFLPQKDFLKKIEDVRELIDFVKTLQ